MSHASSRPIVSVSDTGISSPARSAADDVTMRRRGVVSTVWCPTADAGTLTEISCCWKCCSMANQRLVMPRHILHLVMRPALDDLAALHDDDLVGVANRAQTVGDDDAG